MLNSQFKNDDSLELILKKLHEQKIKWRLHGRNSLSWAFYCAIDGLEFNVKFPQIMQCVVFHKVLVGLEILNQQTRLKKGLPTYFKNNPIYLIRVSFLNFFEPQTLLGKKMCNIKSLYKTSIFLLSKTIYLFNLLKAFG